MMTPGSVAMKSQKRVRTARMPLVFQRICQNLLSRPKQRTVEHLMLCAGTQSKEE